MHAAIYEAEVFQSINNFHDYLARTTWRRYMHAHTRKIVFARRLVLAAFKPRRRKSFHIFALDTSK